ncbi:hypothetical protein OJF2_68870 [Aquisphaera giovannonii]|uniref:Uncharacterized protein n=1 Tax=Aquisphaera giovannonii TaxID=406548 RepID=A0A5B9WDH5_9BACT|nr:hypothetical protein [Aquisphaera giovannonii]QEH38289.1 hypothetical protein OJF2_68870 [Aquisphaera giovannonii]
MTSSSEATRPRRRWPRWLAIGAAVAVAGLALLVLAIPWIVGMPWMQRRLAAAGSRYLAPGAVDFDRLRVSWFGRTEIENLALIDPQGDRVVVAPRALVDWSLKEILVTQPKVLTLTLDHAAVDVERSESGAIDLLDTLRPILSDEPVRDILVRVRDGSLRFRDAHLSEPFHADRADIDLDLNAAPRPIAWRLDLEQDRDSGGPGKLDIRGRAGRAPEAGGGPGDIELAVRADRWPWVVSRPDLRAGGELDGTIDVAHGQGRTAASADVRLLGVRAGGSRLSGDELSLDAVGLVGKVSREGPTWTAEAIDLSLPFAKAHATGSYPPAGDRGGRVEASLDLPGLARQLPHTLRLREGLKIEKGSVALLADVQGDPAGPGQAISADIRLADLAARRGEQLLTFPDPATFLAKLRRASGSFSLDQLDVKTPFLTATGKGDPDRGIDVAATVDLDAADGRLRNWVDMGKVAVGGKGSFDGHYKRTGDRFEAHADSAFEGLKITGLPVLETFQRDRETASLKATGGASPSGLPLTLHDFAFTGKGDGEELTATATLDRAANVLAGEVRGKVQVVIAGKKQVAEGTVRGRWGESEITADPIVAALSPVVGPGGQFLPADPKTWSGAGRYDAARDELLIEEKAPTPGAPSTAFAVSPTRVRVSGLKSRDAAAVDAQLAGDLSRLGLDGWGQGRLAGRLEGLIQGRQDASGWDLGARVQVRELATLDGQGGRQLLADEVSAGLRGKVLGKLESVDLAEIGLITPYGRIQGGGTVADLKSEPKLDLKGTLSPDWTVLSDLLARKVEPNASMSGSDRAWSVSGTLPRAPGGKLPEALRGEVGLNLEHLDVFGMKLGRAPIVVRAEGGKVRIDPIDSTLNSGTLHLEPEVVADDKGGTWLHMGPASRLMDAVVNDEVSHRVLSYAAPVLDQATRVQGRVSLALGDAYFPISAGEKAEPRVDGDVLFDNVEFMPGPLADQLLGVFRQERRPLLVLRDPVSVRVVGRTVYQEGLVIPLGNVAAIGIDGSMDFDQNLKLVASFAVAPPQREIPVLSKLLEETQIQVPITGTLKKPRIDGDAVAERFKNMGLNMLDNLLGPGASGLGRLFQRRPGDDRPRDFFPPFRPPTGDEPGAGETGRTPAPPRPGGDARRGDDADEGVAKGANGPDGPTPMQLRREERKARRLERKADRRMRRGLPPE